MKIGYVTSYRYTQIVKLKPWLKQLARGVFHWLIGSEYVPAISQ